MNNQNNLVAPQIDDIDEVYSLWKNSTGGSRAQFYDFMTTPSVERNRFLMKLDVKNEFVNNCLIQTFSIPIK